MARHVAKSISSWCGCQCVELLLNNHDIPCQISVDRFVSNQKAAVSCKGTHASKLTLILSVLGHVALAINHISDSKRGIIEMISYACSTRLVLYQVLTDKLCFVFVTSKSTLDTPICKWWPNGRQMGGGWVLAILSAIPESAS